MASPAEILGELLPNTIVGGSTGWGLKIGKMVDTPHKLIACYDTGGQNPNPAWLLDFVTVQAMVRGGPNEYGDAWTKARAVRDFLLGIEPFDAAGGDRWVSVICQGDVAFVAYDDKDRPQFSVNFRIIIEPSSGDNRQPL